MGKREEKGRGMVKEEEKGKTVIVSGRDIAESMDFCCNLLPGDLILDILSRLPVKFAPVSTQNSSYGTLPQESVGVFQNPESLRTFIILNSLFHHHPTIDDYKLLRFCFHYDNYGNTSTINTRLDVFTLSTNSWREIDPVVIPRQNYRFTDLVAVNGSWHWLGGKVGKLRNLEDFVFAFAVVEEKFRQIEVPCSDCANYVEFCRTLSVFQETLAMFVFPSLLSERNSCFDIWVLNDYGAANESWTKQLTVGPIPIVATPQGFWISGEVIMKRFKHDNDAFLYDPLTREIKNFPSCMAAKCEFFRYTESLVSVK
ncbi:hypothetical protein F0562_033004 [Nyssa sinensis]|uniref:F-box associated beta-propeller type 1 domain-containing protein n=1 Tax=Nyssa sinensis TaxID=561372 RepID=A0A5J5ARG9_9ASTE|nr:hypothetical protein F0562_033004 [Nyssa sinensis]